MKLRKAFFQILDKYIQCLQIRDASERERLKKTYATGHAPSANPLSALICVKSIFNQHQSASINTKEHQSESSSINQHPVTPIVLRVRDLRSPL